MKKNNNVNFKNMKRNIATIIFLIIGFSFYACDPDNDDNDIIPPAQQILLEDTTGTMGDITVDVYYVKNAYSSDLKYAPADTEVHLYLSEYDLDNYLPYYKFITEQSHTIYMGYLPKDTYYLLAFARINGSDYEGVAPIIIRQRHERVNLTMTKLPDIDE